MPGCELIVAIPARDEAASVARTLEAFATQVDEHGVPLDPDRFEVILLANNCSDGTADAARQTARRYAHMRMHVVDVALPSHCHVGHARRMVMDEASRRFSRLGKPGGVIATTDADTLVSTHWISATLIETSRGADAVGGRILLDRSELDELGPRGIRYHLHDVGYRSLAAELESLIDPAPHDPWPRHFQHFGASMAVTAEAYRRAGGLPVLPCLEDVGLYERLVSIDARIRHSPDVLVTTSARSSGRTSFGFAVQLSRWEQMERDGTPFLVESVGGLEARMRAIRDLRSEWKSGREACAAVVLDLADRLCVPAQWLASAVATTHTFGSLTQQIAEMQQQCGTWQCRWPLVEIQHAIRSLRHRLDELRKVSGHLPLLEQVQPVRRLAPAKNSV